jgi:hypothetical protein
MRRGKAYAGVPIDNDGDFFLIQLDKTEEWLDLLLYYKHGYYRGRDFRKRKYWSLRWDITQLRLWRNRDSLLLAKHLPHVEEWVTAALAALDLSQG